MELPTAVLIINYRVYEELGRALTSLEPFLRPGDEVVVVDQASDRAILTQLARRHPRVQFVASRGFATRRGQPALQPEDTADAYRDPRPST